MLYFGKLTRNQSFTHSLGKITKAPWILIDIMFNLVLFHSYRNLWIYCWIHLNSLWIYLGKNPLWFLYDVHIVYIFVPSFFLTERGCGDLRLGPTHASLIHLLIRGAVPPWNFWAWNHRRLFPWLVVWTPLKNMKVNWDDDIPKMATKPPTSPPSVELLISRGMFFQKPNVRLT